MAFILALFNAAAWAKTIHVYPADEGFFGVSEVSGFNNIDWYNDVSPGDTLLLYGAYGPYKEFLQVLAKGTPDHPITIKAAPGETPIIESFLWLTQSEYVVVDGLTITSSPYSGVMLQNGSRQITISNCVIKNNAGGVWIGEGAGDNNKIIGNEIFLNSTNGIAVDKAELFPR